jgi:hypothetical protein
MNKWNNLFTANSFLYFEDDKHVIHSFHNRQVHEPDGFFRDHGEGPTSYFGPSNFRAEWKKEDGKTLIKISEINEGGAEWIFPSALSGAQLNYLRYKVFTEIFTLEKIRPYIAEAAELLRGSNYKVTEPVVAVPLL